MRISTANFPDVKLAQSRDRGLRFGGDLETIGAERVAKVHLTRFDPMLDMTKTTSSLLAALMDREDQGVWYELDGRYRPVVMGLARKMGLSNADAEDVAQEMLSKLVTAYREGKYDRTRGRLRSWIVQIARNCIVDAHRARSSRGVQRGDSAITGVPSENEFERLWDEEHRGLILDRALSELRGSTRMDERTIRAFEEVGLRGRSAEEVASDLGLSIDSVYAAKSRCTKELREIVSRLSIVYEIE